MLGQSFAPASSQAAIVARSCGVISLRRIKKSSEDAKVACRNIRRDANKACDTAEKSKEMTEDERDKGKEQVQDLLKTFEDKIADMADKKTKEILEQ